MKKKIVLWISIIVTSIAVLFVGVTIMINRSQPTDKEYAKAHALVSSAERAISNERQSILFEASRDVVIINAYGFMEADDQNKVLDGLRATLMNGTLDVKIKVLFFPPREYFVEKKSDGKQVSRLKKMDAIRRVELN